MQYWVTVDEKYLNYLRQKESRIPYSDYGRNKFKPFFGVLFEKDGLSYVAAISHAQEKHLHMKSSLDFCKIFLPDRNPQKSDRLVAVINLNYMFPVPKSLLERLDYKNISKHREFASKKEESLYIDLLEKELQTINSMHVDVKAKKLYDLKYNAPNNWISVRCLDFIELEKHAAKYE